MQWFIKTFISVFDFNGQWTLGTRSGQLIWSGRVGWPKLGLGDQNLQLSLMKVFSKTFPTSVDWTLGEASWNGGRFFIGQVVLGYHWPLGDQRWQFSWHLQPFVACHMSYYISYYMSYYMSYILSHMSGRVGWPKVANSLCICNLLLNVISSSHVTLTHQFMGSKGLWVDRFWFLVFALIVHAIVTDESFPTQDLLRQSIKTFSVFSFPHTTKANSRLKYLQSDACPNFKTKGKRLQRLGQGTGREKIRVKQKKNKARVEHSVAGQSERVGGNMEQGWVAR